MSDIKSTAVVKYSAMKAPAPYCELAVNADLNTPPANWLRGRFAMKEPFVPGQPRIAAKELSSFSMANNFLECVGKVDVITDGDNVKKLLKMPYSKQQISMVVHRVGRTLLIDPFDVYNRTLWTQQHEWKWLREFIVKHLIEDEETVQKAIIPAEQGCRRKVIDEKLMLSKFLYYSLADDNSDILGDDLRVDSPDSKGILPDPLETQDDSNGPTCLSAYERNLLWNFEDIRMLVGNDMPIFGGGTHPCVSLRLRDMKKPINVLTGIDYWLDQLMCNVPEVVMCYHLSGIVQKYEVIKTEDLPNVPECRFNSEIVRDVAQNILSFLKSNATKEGHTYWLFRAHDDDVVKLYDLTSICKEYISDLNANPFTLPVAVLMYRVAKSLMQKSTSTSMKAAPTIYRLLNHCLELIDKKRYPQIAGSVHYLLATMYITCGTPTDTSDKSTSKDDQFGSNCDDDFEDSFDASDWSIDDPRAGSSYPLAKEMRSNENNCSSVSLNILMKPDGVPNPEPAAVPPVNDAKRVPNCSNLEDCCKSALEHILEGLECAEMSISDDEGSNRNKNDQATKATPDEPIPLHYEPLRQSEATTFLPLAVRQPTATTWQLELSTLLLTKAVTAYFLLADCAHKLQRYGKALRYLKISLLCFESVRRTIDGLTKGSANLQQSKRSAQASLPSILTLCGDVHIALCHQKAIFLIRHRGDYSAQMYRDEKICAQANKSSADDDQNEFASCVELPERIDQNLIVSCKCYELAIKYLKQSVTESGGKEKPLESSSTLAGFVVDSFAITRRQGNVKNELGAYYMNVASAILNNEKKAEDGISKAETYWNLSFNAFQEAIELFTKIQDNANVALLNSNCGRLMRICAHSYIDSDAQFNANERYYLQKAIDFYQRALECVNPQKSETHRVWESIAWDLSSTYFNYATYLQDRPPLRTSTIEEIEREIVDFMNKALRLVESLDRMDSLKHDVYSYRISTIHHKLATLYHKLFREKENEKDRKSKQLRSLAELHYAKAADGFREVVAENPCEYLRVELERIALLERVCENTTSTTAKLKIYDQAMQLLLSCRQPVKVLHRKMAKTNSWSRNDINSTKKGAESSINADDGIDDDNNRESVRNGDGDSDEQLTKDCETLCGFVVDRAQATGKNALKILKQNNSSVQKNDALLERWKRVYRISLLKLPEDVASLPGVVLQILDELAAELE